MCLHRFNAATEKHASSRTRPSRSEPDVEIDNLNAAVEQVRMELDTLKYQHSVLKYRYELLQDDHARCPDRSIESTPVVVKKPAYYGSQPKPRPAPSNSTAVSEYHNTGDASMNEPRGKKKKQDIAAGSGKDASKSDVAGSKAATQAVRHPPSSREERPSYLRPFQVYHRNDGDVSKNESGGKNQKKTAGGGYGKDELGSSVAAGGTSGGSASGGSASGGGAVGGGAAGGSVSGGSAAGGGTKRKDNKPREDKNDTYPGEVNSESLEESMYSTDSDAGDPDFVPGPATRPKPTTAKKTRK